MRLLRALTAFGFAAFAVCLSCRPVEAVSADPVEAEAEEWLVQYVRIDTTNPPGNETAGAQFLESILTKEGIPSRLLGSDPRRQSLYARLEAPGDEPAILLLHHIDVVPANPGEWSVPPFEGRRSNGYVWGRGTLDVKSLGIAWLAALLDLHRSGAALRRDVIFLAVADEEAGGTRGVEMLLAEHPDLFANVGLVLNEGGANETIVDRITFWGIEIDQKVPLWLRLTATGPPGHGAVPPADGGSTMRLLDALAAVRAIPRPLRLTPSVEVEFKAIAPIKPGVRGEILRDPARWIDSPRLTELPHSYHALLRDTLAITRISAESTVNSVPARAVADLDVRLLPGSDAGPMLEAVRTAAGRNAEVEILLRGEPSPPAPLDTPYFRVLERVLRSEDSGSRVGPIVSPGTSDSRFFRQKGVLAYGISPFKVNYYDGANVHGVDEKIRARFFAEGVRLARRLVRALATAPLA